MKRKILQRLVIGLACAMALSGLLYLALVISLADDPRGKYASYELFPHHRLDIIRFENGKVRSETCCGNEDWGTYAKDSSGQWIWKHELYTRPRIGPPKVVFTQEFVVRRSLFGIEIRSLTGSPTHLFMRRRLFNTYRF